MIETVSDINIVTSTPKASSIKPRPIIKNQLEKDEVNFSCKETKTEERTNSNKGILNNLKNLGKTITNFASDYLSHISTIDKNNACIIQPKNFKESKGSYLWPTFLDKYINDIEPYSEQARIKSEYNPTTLKKVSGFRRTLDASNFAYPNGTVAIPAKLNEALSTSGLLQCAAVAIVDKKQNMQTLIHCCPTVDGNEELLKYIFSHSKPEDLDVTIVPGYYKDTDATVNFLVDTIEKYAPEAKLNYANFPDKDIDVLILEHGELKCGTKKNIIPTTNPKDRIVHA